jgi:hypothetical protein
MNFTFELNPGKLLEMSSPSRGYDYMPVVVGKRSGPVGAFLDRSQLMPYYVTVSPGDDSQPLPHPFGIILAF